MYGSELSKGHATSRALVKIIRSSLSRFVTYSSGVCFYGRGTERFREFSNQARRAVVWGVDPIGPDSRFARTSTKCVRRSLGPKAHCAPRQFLVISGCFLQFTPY
jgi:hypothetical protein